MNTNIKHYIYYTGLLLLIIAAFQSNACAQTSFTKTGFPFIVNYTNKEYQAHSQNFAITKDERGKMYFGNFSGILEFDGLHWNHIQTDDFPKVYALTKNDKEVIFAGGRGYFGYLKSDSTGALQFVHLNDLLQGTEPGEIKRIHTKKDTVYFVSDDNVFIYTTGKLKITGSQKKIVSSYLVRDRLFFQLRSSADLYVLKDDSLVLFPSGSFLSDAIDIKAMLPYKKDEMLLVTDLLGILHYKDQYTVKFASEATEYLVENNPGCATILKDGSIAIGTELGGVVVIAMSGKLKYILNKELGLQSNSINEVFAEDDGLWLALNNGISRIEVPSQIGFFNEKTELEGSVLDIHRFDSTLYIAGYNGLFYQNRKTSHFEKTDQINTACWSLAEINNRLLVASSKGVYSVNKHTAKQLSEGFSLCLYHYKVDKNTVFVGQTDGLSVLSYKDGVWNFHPSKVVHNVEIREIAEDKTGVLWMVSPSDGILSFDPQSKRVHYFSEKDSLPSQYGNHVFTYYDNVFFSTIKGIYKFDKKSALFLKADVLQGNNQFSNVWHGAVYVDLYNKIWTVSGDETNITMHGETSNPKSGNKNNYFTQIKDFVVWSIFFDTDSCVWFGGPEGLIHYNQKEKHEHQRRLTASIVRVVSDKDSVLLAGNIKADSLRDQYNKIILPYGKSIQFKYTAHSYNYKEDLRFRYFLAGFDKDSSGWSKEDSKEYTNLPGGKYVFSVRAKNVFGVESDIEKISFVILSPWYKKWYAWILYILIFSGLVLLVGFWRHRKLVKEKDVLENLIKTRTAEVVEQKEEIEHQSLELAGKNSELEKINTIVKSINAQLEVSNMLQSVLEKTRVINGVDKATALLYDQSTDSYSFKASYGWDLSSHKLGSLKISHEEAEKRYIHGTHELYEDIFYSRNVEALHNIESLNQLEQPKSMLVIVMKSETRVEGFLIMENMQTADAFSDKDLSLVKNLKEHIISAFIKAEILENLQDTLLNLKNTQEELIRQEKLASVGQLTKGIVDRIINPLNYINNYSGISKELVEEIKEIIDAEKDKLTADSLEELYEVIDLITENMSKINSHGESSARIVKGMEKLLKDKSFQFAVFPVNDMLEKQIDPGCKECSQKYDNISVAVHFDFDKDAGYVNIMQQEFSQALLYLIDNAFYVLNEKRKVSSDYTPEITIKTLRKDDTVEISIRDNGTGMPRGEIDKVFDPFFTTKTTSQGTGLGLYMVKDIIESHNGSMRAESEEGTFTEIFISLKSASNQPVL